jgi:hypothetical protein
MEPFTNAPRAISQAMRDGVASHPNNDWVRRSVKYHTAAPKIICGSSRMVISRRTTWRMRPHGC